MDSQIDSWEEFDIFSLDKTSKGRTLEMVCMVLLEELQLMDSLKLDRSKMRKFLQVGHCSLHNSAFILI